MSSAQYLASNVNDICVSIKEWNQHSTWCVNILHVQRLAEITLHKSNTTSTKITPQFNATIDSHHLTTLTNSSVETVVTIFCELVDIISATVNNALIHCQHTPTYCIPQCILALAVPGKTSCKQTILSADKCNLGRLWALMAFTFLYHINTWLTVINQLS